MTTLSAVDAAGHRRTLCRRHGVYLHVDHRRWGVEVEWRSSAGYWEVRLLGRATRTLTWRSTPTTSGRGL